MLPRIFSVSLCAGLLALHAASARESEPAGRCETAGLREVMERLQAEVAALRKAVARLELERQRDVIRQINAELDSVRGEQARLTETERTRAQEFAEIDEWLNGGSALIQDRPAIQAAQIELAAQAQEIDRKLAAVRVREGELLRALHAEEEKTKALEGATKTLGGKTP